MVATTIVLISVFAPLMFLPGYIGRLFVELAVAVAAAVFFSAVLALSLSPMLSSKLLRPAHGEGWLARRVDAGMNRLRGSYQASLDMLLGGRRVALVVGVGVALLAVIAGGLFVSLPKEVVPSEDRGRIDLQFQGPEGAGYDYTLKAALQAKPTLDRLREQGLVTHYVIGVPRFNQNQFNTGFGNVVLSDWRHRKITSQKMASDLNREFGRITGLRVIGSVRGPFQRSGGGSNVDFIVEGNDYPEIARWMRPILQAAENNPGLARPRLDYEPSSPRLIVDLDRDKAAALGVSAESVGRVLQAMFGSQRVTTYIKNGQEYDVILQTNLDQRRTLKDLNTLYVRGASGDLIPLSNVVTTEVRGDTPDRARTDRQRSVTLTAELQPGYTVGEAMTMPPDGCLDACSRKKVTASPTV